MSGYLLDAYPASSTIYCLFDSFAASTGAPSTISGFATSDIQIYKNGSTTQRSSTSGFALLDTDGIDFDAVTGINGFSVDLSDNTDSGFYAAGATYSIVISTIMIDSQTVSFVVGTFRIVAAENTAGTPAADAVRIGGTSQTGADLGAINVSNLNTLSGHDPGATIGTSTLTLANITTTALTEDYSTKNGTVTLTQAVYEILSLLQEKSASGTTLTAKKRDGSTTAMTFTADSSTAPSSLTRAT